MLRHASLYTCVSLDGLGVIFDGLTFCLCSGGSASLTSSGFKISFDDGALFVGIEDKFILGLTSRCPSEETTVPFGKLEDGCNVIGILPGGNVIGILLPGNVIGILPGGNEDVIFGDENAVPVGRWVFSVTPKMPINVFWSL